MKLTLKTYKRGHIFKSSKKTLTFMLLDHQANRGPIYNHTHKEQIGKSNSFVEVKCIIFKFAVTYFDALGDIHDRNDGTESSEDIIWTGPYQKEHSRANSHYFKNSSSFISLIRHNVISLKLHY